MKCNFCGGSLTIEQCLVRVDRYELVCSECFWVSQETFATAEEALERADEICLKAERTPFHLSPHLKTQLDLDLYRLRESIKGDNSPEVQAFQRKAFKSL